MPPLTASAQRLEAHLPASEGLPRVLDDDGGEPRRRPLRLGILTNPLSGQNARRGLLPRVRALLSAHPAVAQFEASTGEAMAAAVDELLRADTEIIAVNGGDGTVQAVLTMLLSAPLAALPLLAVLPGGTTNSTARNVGYTRRPLRALQRLVEEAARGTIAGAVERWPVVRVDGDGDPRFAMMFGAGAVYHGISFFHREVLSRGVGGQFGAGVAVVTALGHVVSGRTGHLFPPLHAEIAIDGTAVSGGPYFGILTSTMTKQILNLRPYWGVGPGPLRFSSLSYAPRGLARAIVPALRGRQSPHLRPDLGYRSANADEVRLAFDSGYVLDGQLFAPGGPRTHLTLSARQHAYFLRERP